MLNKCLKLITQRETAVFVGVCGRKHFYSMPQECGGCRSGCRAGQPSIVGLPARFPPPLPTSKSLLWTEAAAK